MYLVVGLGNPGGKYDKTRHNVGFDVIDLFAEKHNISINRIKFKGIYGETTINGEKVIVLKPQTFMNLSGESVREVCDFYKIPNDNVIVVYDDISLDIGTIRIRTKGSAGGHNGIKNIISHLSTEVFPRIKMGVGQPKYDLVDHVLGKFSTEERELLEKTFEPSVQAIETIIINGIAEAMNKFNGIKA